MNLKKILNKDILIYIIGIILISPVYGITDIQSEFNKLTSDINTLPSEAFPGNSFMAKVSAAQAAVDRNQLCTAINILGALRNEIKAGTGKKGFMPINANQIDTDVISIIALLLERPETARCGGGIAPSIGNSPKTTIVSSNDKEIQFHISFPRAHFVPRIGNNEPFIDMSIDGMGYVSGIGKPDIPALTQLFAIPIGAVVSVKLLGSTSYKIDNIKLWPRQEDPGDQLDFGNRPFKIDTQFYGTDAFYPTDPTKTGALGPMRDLNIGGIETDGAQYIPATKSLKVYTGMDLKITFEGENTGKFGDIRTISPWNMPFKRTYEKILINYRVLKDPAFLKAIHDRLCANIPADIIIVTSHDLLPVAKSYADAKTKDGFGVSISEVGNGPGQIGTTPEEIQLNIQQKIDWWGGPCTNRPSYVTIVGDTANVPTFQVSISDYIGIEYGYTKIPSDYPYGLRPYSTTLFPNAMIGRIPVSPSSSPYKIIQKIIDYEHNPPSSDAFYSRATIASYFQGYGPIDEKGYIKTSETIRNELINLGYNIDRVYTDIGPKPDCPSPCNLPTYPKEEQYYDGTPIPAELRRPGFLWEGSTQDIIDQWNNGRFIILHNDHGGEKGWTKPLFKIDNISSLNNGNLLPVVFSIDCLGGKFDDVTPNFNEQLIQKIDGGAVGVIGDSGIEGSFTSDHLVLGLFDSIFPSLLPYYGSSSPITRMGDVLNNGKLYMDTQNGLDFQDNRETKAEHYLIHWFGDPTMQIWTEKPNWFKVKDLGFEFTGSLLKARLDQLGAEEALLTVRQGEDVIGRAQLINGEAQIKLLKEFNGEPLYLSLDKESFIPVQVRLEVNIGTATISGTKFNDYDGNGTRDQGEPGLANWTMVLIMPNFNATTTTNIDGLYSFNNLQAGNYSVCEVQQPGWRRTQPQNPCYNIALSTGQNLTDIDFGNQVQLG